MKSARNKFSSQVRVRKSKCDIGKIRNNHIGIGHAMFLIGVIFAFIISMYPGIALAQGRPVEARQTKAIFDLLDTNHDGKISVSEFKNNQMLIFYIWDKNKDLVLTPDETPLPPDVFRRIAGENSKIDTMEFMNVVDSAFERADINRDGFLTLDEFTKMRQLVRHK